MLAEINKLQENILDIKYGRVKEGLKIGVTEIDEHLRFKQGNFNIIIGHANVGKTTVIIYMMLLYTIKHKIKWLVFSAENTPQSIARKIVEFKSGKPITKMSDEEIQETVDLVKGQLKANKYWSILVSPEGKVEYIVSDCMDRLYLDGLNNLIERKNKIGGIILRSQDG